MHAVLSCLCFIYEMYVRFYRIYKLTSKRFCLCMHDLLFANAIIITVNTYIAAIVSCKMLIIFVVIFV